MLSLKLWLWQTILGARATLPAKTGARFESALQLLGPRRFPLRLLTTDRRRSRLPTEFADMRRHGTSGLVAMRGRRMAPVPPRFRHRMGGARDLTVLDRLPLFTAIDVFKLLTPLRTRIGAGMRSRQRHLLDCRLDFA